MRTAVTRVENERLPQLEQLDASAFRPSTRASLRVWVDAALDEILRDIRPDAVGLRSRSIFAWLENEPPRASRLSVLPRVWLEIDEGAAWVAPIEAIDPLLGPGGASLLRLRLEESGLDRESLAETFPFLTDPESPTYQDAGSRLLADLPAAERAAFLEATEPELRSYARGMDILARAPEKEISRAEILVPREAVVSLRVDEGAA